MVRTWRVLTSSHAFVRPQLRMLERSLTVSRFGSGLASFNVDLHLHGLLPSSIRLFAGLPTARSTRMERYCV
jgi:hypothetical protein